MSRFTIAAAAATLALFGLAMSAHAYTSNNIPGGMLFDGQHVTRADKKAGTSITVNGSYDPADMIIQIIDPNNSTATGNVDCVVDQQSEVVPATNEQNGGPVGDTASGIVTLHPDYCYYTNQGKSSSFTPTNARFTFNWHISDSVGDWNITAATMYLMLPGICEYNGFSGVGSITKQPVQP